MTKLWASSLLLLIVMFFIPVILLRGPSAEPQEGGETNRTILSD